MRHIPTRVTGKNPMILLINSRNNINYVILAASGIGVKHSDTPFRE